MTLKIIGRAAGIVAGAVGAVVLLVGMVVLGIVGALAVADWLAPLL